MEVEILVLFVGPQPGGKAAGFMNDDGAVIDIEIGVRAVADGPPVQRLPVKK